MKRIAGLSFLFSLVFVGCLIEWDTHSVNRRDGSSEPVSCAQCHAYPGSPFCGAPNPGQNSTRLKPGGIYGTENDYEARAASITVEQDLFQRNTTIGARYLTNDDRIVTDTPFAALIHAEGEEPAGRKKRTHTLNLLVTHGITPRTLGSAVVQYRIHRGYLAHPYHAVRIGDLFYPERYPRTRSAVVGKGTLKHYVTFLQGLVLDASYRHYRDTWSMRSHTVDAAVFLRPWKRVGFGPLYRYYRQTSAFFYQDRYQSPRRFRAPIFATDGVPPTARG